MTTWFFFSSTARYWTGQEEEKETKKSEMLWLYDDSTQKTRRWLKFCVFFCIFEFLHATKELHTLWRSFDFLSKPPLERATAGGSRRELWINCQLSCFFRIFYFFLFYSSRKRKLWPKDELFIWLFCEMFIILIKKKCSHIKRTKIN